MPAVRSQAVQRPMAAVRRPSTRCAGVDLEVELGEFVVARERRRCGKGSPADDAALAENETSCAADSMSLTPWWAARLGWTLSSADAADEGGGASIPTSGDPPAPRAPKTPPPHFLPRLDPLAHALTLTFQGPAREFQWISASNRPPPRSGNKRTAQRQRLDQASGLPRSMTAGEGAAPNRPGGRVLRLAPASPLPQRASPRR